MAKTKAKTVKAKIATKMATTSDVAERVYLGVKKGKIVFGDMKETQTDHSITRVWKAEPLENGTDISFVYDHKKGKNANGKDYNPRYKISITHKETSEEVSGTFARKIYLRLMNPPKKRTSKLNAETATVMENALAGI